MTTSPAVPAHAETAAPRAARQRDVGLLVLRLVVFGLLAVHGAQKLFGAFGGPGLSGTAEMVGQLGYAPAGLFAFLVAASEFGGGVLLVLGLLTPLSSAMALGVMINAVVVQLDSGLSGFGHPLLIATVALTFAITGPGRYALDHGRSWQRTGPAWAAASIGLAAVTALLSLLVRMA